MIALQYGVLCVFPLLLNIARRDISLVDGILRKRRTFNNLTNINYVLRNKIELKLIVIHVNKNDRTNEQ